MQKYHISPSEALEQIRQSRPLCEPNEGFMKQLELYHEMQTPENVEDTPTYQRWVYQREVEMSRACGQAPEAEKIRFEDEHVAAKDDNGFDMRCRKCRQVTHSLASSSWSTDNLNRRTLATSQFLIPHQAQRGPADSCTHYFLDPLSWMRPELEKGEVEGRLECPNAKCKANVGKYAWQGMRCSCGEWIVPAISLSKGRIDEAKKRVVDPSAMGIRMPATANPRGPGQNNL